MEIESDSISQVSMKIKGSEVMDVKEGEGVNRSVVMTEGQNEEEEQKEGQTPPASRCINERQRQLLVAIFGIGLSGLMTFSLIFLLNKIKG